jgi:hypothetical protein
LTVGAELRADEPAPPVIPKTGLTLSGFGRGGRSPVVVDALEFQRLDGMPASVSEGDEVKVANGGTRKWVKTASGNDGAFRANGYLRLEVESASDRVMILHGGSFLFASVNGEPRVGDPYGTGWVQTPVLMKKGKNEILIQPRGGAIKPELTVPPADVFLTNIDLTLPDLLAGVKQTYWAGVRVINASPKTESDLSFAATLPGGKTQITPIPDPLPLSQNKFPCQIEVGELTGEKTTLTLGLVDKIGRPVGPKPLEIELAIRKPSDKHRRTFISDIDGSVQYYSVVPATPGPGEKPGLTLTLHGAGVEASGQAACFTPKSWTHVIAATNRRPFGFDWEDWGRLDALEVLADARVYLHPDPRRSWLTGHSMGGHGTWQIGVTYPDQFAAIGPSAGWISFFSYAGMRQSSESDPISAMLRRATLPSDTLALEKNYKSEGVFILHGDKDDNVPVTEARRMREQLAKFHADWAYYERPGAGHWWGNDCVDWKPMFQFFDSRTLPEWKDVRRVEFATASPGISARCFWASVEAQVKPYELSTIDIQVGSDKHSFSGKTKNVARLALSAWPLTGDHAVNVTLDGQEMQNLKWPGERGTLWFEFANGHWASSSQPSPELKGPQRNGSFKNAFRHYVTLVYGTQGTPEENAWALAKARYDAETFWYRGNGSIRVIPDVAFEAGKARERNVVLYGNADTNAAWQALLKDGPLQVHRGSLKLGDREIKGDDLACLFVRPRPESETATVGVVSGTGIKGFRTTNRQPYFVSGVGYPDLLILDSTSLLNGASGIRAAGYFGNDWSVEQGDIAWR